MNSIPAIQSAIETAEKHLESAGIRGFRIRSAKYHESESPAALLGEHADLLAEFNREEFQVVKDFGRPCWAIVMSTRTALPTLLRTPQLSLCTTVAR